MRTIAFLSLSLFGCFALVGCDGSSAQKDAGSPPSSGGFLGSGGTAAGGAPTGGTTANQGGSGSGGSTGGMGGAGSGGKVMDASSADAVGSAQVDAPMPDAEMPDIPLAGSEVGAWDTSAGSDGSPGGIDAPRTCKNTNATPSGKTCRSVEECGPTGPVKCCTSGSCWPASACPISPSVCPGGYGKGTFKCTTNQDCTTGGTCVSTVSGCPQCETRSCVYPPPPCTQSPDSCSPTGHCQADGGCAPVLCTDGFACGNGLRCNVGSARANGYGCEQIPCNDGWACEENTRCTAPSDPNSHGCTTMTCKQDSECTCGYCVNGACSSNLGGCSFAPQ